MPPAPPPRSLALGSHSSASSHPPSAPSFFLLSLQPPRSSPLPWPTLSPPPPRWLAPHASPPPCGARRCQGRTRLSAGRPRPKPPQEASSSGFLSSHRARGSSLPRSPPPQAGRTSRVAQGAACFFSFYLKLCKSFQTIKRKKSLSPWDKCLNTTSPQIALSQHESNLVPLVPLFTSSISTKKLDA